VSSDRKADGRLAISALSRDLSKLRPIHSGSRHKLYRYGPLDAAVVIKRSATQSTSASAAASVRHESELLLDITLPGIVRVLGLFDTGSGLALAMEDVGDTNLARRIQAGPLSIQAFLDIAVQLAAAVAGLHGVRIIHRDIHPGNIVWNSEREIATLCDFAMANTLPALAMEIPNPNQLEGTLPYMSPEQTGRTGRSVDWRTDLYSLGATFYEMLTLVPPFVGRDAAALAHAQIARLARPPHELNTQVPLTLSRIVLKLLEKDPEQRYQSATALLDDLHEAKKRWLKSAAIEPFPLASHEVPRGLSIPDKLYGRDAELQALADAFARTCAGGRQLMLVTGGPGIGKSALVDHLRPSVSVGSGYYAAGKFDQLQRSVPFSGLAQALRSLVRQLLTESETALDGWRRRIEEAVAPNGQLLLALMPELERLLGPQPTVLEVGPVESRNRFHLVVTRFLRVFARPEHPFVLFLDDLQWVDAASLQLLEQWVSDAASHHLLVIGAYRDNEVGASHPLELSLSRLRDTGCDIQAIHLERLGTSAIAQLAADTFGEEVARMRFLAELILRKSAGNPFFVRRLLHLMHAEGFFRFHSDSQHWTWDESEIEGAPISDNVLDLMTLAIDRLPTSVRKLLEMGACIGHQFELSALAELTHLSPKAVTEQLWPAIEDGLLVPVHATHEPARLTGLLLDDDASPFQATLRFAHDRVQQAAYGLLSEQRRQALHHAIGRRLLERAGDELDENLFEVVDQLDLGEAHVVDDAERRSLVQLNLAAGQKAKASAAYRAAFEYLAVARRHLGAHAWDDSPDLTFAVHRECAESAYLAGEHATAEELIETSLEHAPSKVAKAELYGLRVLAATVASDWPRALHWGRVGLSVFGLEWPQEGLAAAIEAEAAAVMKNLGDRKIEALVLEPDVEDTEIRASMRLLALLGAPAYFSGAEVLTFLFARAVNLSLMHGPSPYSAFAYVLYGGIHNALTGQYDIGYAFGKLALAMAQRFGNRAEECRTLEVYGVLVHHWKAPLREGLPLLKEGFRAGAESGETAFAAFSLNAFLINALPAGMPLNELLEEAAVALDFAMTQKNRTSVEITVAQRQLARALTGRTSAPTSFDDAEFVEARFLEEASRHETALGHYWVAKLQTAYLMGDYESALHCSREAETRILKGILGMITSAEHVFYTALAIAAAATSSPSELSSSLDRLRALHGKLVNWAGHCPQNFAHKVSLVGAEIARLERTPGAATTLYRAAIDEAERHRFIQDEALAHELRARFLLGEHEPAFAAVHWRLARDRYRQWGASVKVSALEREFPEYLLPEPPTPRRGISLDEMALIKASQAIAIETTHERLFEQILRVVVEVAGAQRGALILPAKDELMVHGRIEAAAEVSVSLAPMPLTQCLDLPSAIVRYVMRTRAFLLLPDAGTSSLFASDPVVQRRRVQSVLCIPLVKQSTVLGLIYLEHNAMAGAFTDDLVEIGRVLAAQAVISLENSTLLERLQLLTGALEARVVDRTRELTDQIAARDKAETALRITEARQALLLTLSDELRTLSDPFEMRQVAVRLLGEHLGLARTYFFNVELGADGAWVHVVEPGYRNDPSLHELVGPQALKNFGEETFDGSARGEVVSVADIEDLHGLTERQRAAYRALGVRAFVNVPLLRDDKYTAGIGGHDTRPRQWTTNEFDLIREVAARTWAASERARAEVALREADKQKDDFLAMLGHELRNPLAPISTAVHLLRLRGTAEIAREVSVIDRQTRHIERLVDDLLDVSRITRGKVSLSCDSVEVADLVAGAIELASPLIEQGRHVLSVNVPPRGLVVDVDRGRMMQVFANLLTNAAKYTPAGGSISITAVLDGAEIVISFEDTGTGISAELLPRVFDLFVQSRRTLDRSQGGLGLGLAIVKNLVTMHGGSVSAKSEGHGHGSTFTVRLPEARISPIPVEPEQSPTIARGESHGRRVLIVDDNADGAEMIAQFLEVLGYRTATANDGPDALRIAAEFSPQVALLDIGLPVMDGYELAKRFREQWAQVKLVAITGYGQESDRERAQRAGFQAHLTKPVNFDVLAKLVETLSGADQQTQTPTG
jgi:predicted ATPase/signal transduction histidine kinase/CheY-like chemotaxis protein/tRNA A-37 threonylcarbamoyl transferase component Bud32